MAVESGWKPGMVVTDWAGEEERIRLRVALMRELGIIQLFGMILGPEPRKPSPLEKLAEKVVADDSPVTRRDLRVAEAREEIRARLNDWDIPNARIDTFLDPAIFELD